MPEPTNIATIKPSQPSFSLTPQSLTEALEYAKLIAESEIVPNDYRNKPANVLVAVQMGMELGLPPLQALQNIAVVNGRPAVWGDSLMAIARAHPACEYITETFDERTMTATCKAKRRGGPEEVRTFSRADAEQAGLWGRNTWKSYPKRMLQMRARGFAIRDVFPDALRGIALAEEAQDMPPRDMGVAERVSAPAQREPEALPMISPDEFAQKFPTLEAAIQSGRKTADTIIATLSTKYTLSDEQVRDLRAVTVMGADDDFVNEYDRTEEGDK